MHINPIVYIAIIDKTLKNERFIFLLVLHITNLLYITTGLDRPSNQLQKKGYFIEQIYKDYMKII